MCIYDLLYRVYKINFFERELSRDSVIQISVKFRFSRYI